MPRTIESIVDNYQVATERREAGQLVWDRHLKIKHLLTADDSTEGAQQVGTQIAAVLRSSAWLKDDQQRPGDSEVVMCAEEFEDIEDLEHFNTVLDRLYDLADADRTWIA